MKEIWKDIKGYEKLYQVSNLGSVKSLSKFVKNNKSYSSIGYITKEKILKQFRNRKGYLVVSLCRDGKQKTFRVHRLVAEAFIPNPENKPQVNHINTNKENNHVSNLEWVTNGENQIHAYCNGLNKITQKRKEIIKEKNSKKVVQYDLQGNFIRKWESQSEAAEQLKISNGNISSCCLKKYGCKTAGGYIWRFEKDT